jgi:hypothetical protein
VPPLNTRSALVVAVVVAITAAHRAAAQELAVQGHDSRFADDPPAHAVMQQGRVISRGPITPNAP